jgi:hypothetical protein
MCHPFGDSGMSCSRPSGTNLAPFFENETSGDPWSWLTGGSEPGEPEPLVLVGHAGDARQWQCTAAAQAACAHAFVVDRIAWANGSDVPIEVPQTLDKDTHKPLTPSMTLDQITTVIGPDNELVAAAPFRAGEIASIDPRWNFAGDDILWIARSLGPTPASGGSTRPESVGLIEDATGLLIDSHPQGLDPSYQPARLWQMSTVHGRNCCNGDTLAFYRVESSDGAALFYGRVPGDGSSSSESGATTFGGGYGSEPLVLPAGDYTVTAWLASYDHGVIGPAVRECATQVSLGPLDDVKLNADFPHKLACTFQQAPSPTSAPPNASELSPSESPSPSQSLGPVPITSLSGALDFTPDAGPPDSSPRISARRAANVYLQQVNLSGPPSYVVHGIAEAIGKSPATPAWLIIAKAPPMAPIPVGPMCSDAVACHWAVNDWASGLVDDRTGHILRSVATMRVVPAPSPTPSAPG